MAKEDKLYRLTFSESLANRICELSPGHQVRRVQFLVGRKLEPGEKSASGLYGIMDSRKNFALRIAMSQEICSLLVDNHWRYAAEIWLMPM